MNKRITLRAIDYDTDRKSIRQVIEQSIPANEHEIGLALRRDSFRRLIANSLLNNGVTTLEIK